MKNNLRLTLAGLALLLAGAPAARAQTTPGVGIGTTTPDASAVLDLSSTSQGLLLPRMTGAQAAAIQNPKEGLLVYRTDGLRPGLWVYHAVGGWASLASEGADNLGNHTASQNLDLAGKLLVGNGGSSGLGISSSGNVGIGSSSPRGRLDVGSGDTYLVQDANSGNSQNLYLPGHIFLAPYNGSSGTAYLQARVPNPASGTNIGLNLRTTHDSGIVEALQLSSNGYVGIGTAALNRVDVQHAGRTGTHPTGRALYVTGDFGEAANGVEFRHSNATQGVGIGYNSLYAAGANPDQPLNLMPKGSAGVGIGTTTPSQKLEVAGQIYSSTGGFRFPDGTVQTSAATGGTDNLGNHTATQNLNLGANKLVGNGGSSGISIANGGNVSISSATPTAALQVSNNTVTYLGSYGASISGQGTITASSNFSSLPYITPSNVGDNDLETAWQSADVDMPQWVQVDFGSTPRTIRRYEVSSVNVIALQAPGSWVLAASHDGSSWTVLHAGSTTTVGETAYNLPNTTAYRYYRLTMNSRIQSNSYTRLALVEWRLKQENTQPYTALLVASGALQLESGVPVRNISTDGNLTANADDVLPTQKAVKTYVTTYATPDNLGNHTATRNLNLADKLLVGNGGSTGLAIGSSGRLGIGGITTPTNWLDAQSAARSGAHPTDRPLYATGNFGEAADGVEFRHSNGMQGVGIGMNSLYAAGSNANQPLNLLPKGSSGVGVGTTTPAASAMLDVTATNKGFLPPRLAQTQRDAISSPAAGLVIFNTTTNHLNVFDGSYWTESFGTTPPLEGSRNWTVPPGVTSVLIDMAGAEGTAHSSSNPVGSPVVSPGGKGGRVQATLAVTPGSLLNLTVATGAGRASTVTVTPAGGGASSLALVAGGGGTAGYVSSYFSSNAPPVQAGGPGGGTTGGSGAVGAPGGTQTAGGAVGGGSNGATTTRNATPGTYLYGGQGGQTFSVSGFGTTYFTGGNGGDGYYGGGGGRPMGGGGGGSSYADPGVASAVVHTQGYQSGNGYIRLTPNRPIEAPAISLSSADTGQGNGAVLFSDNGKISGNPSQLTWDKTNNRLGLGTNAPTTTLDVNGSQLVRGALGFGNATRQMLNLWGDNYGIGIQNNTQYFRSADSFAWFVGGSHSDAQFNAGGGTAVMVLKAGQLGIGTTTPACVLDVPNGSVHLPGDSWIRYFGDNKNYLRGTTILADDGTGGRVGIGTANPSFPLDVQSTVTPGNYAYAFFAAASNGTANSGSTGSNTGPVSIRATGRVLATEFNATSDRRLKTVIGLSDRAVDLALLQQIRITDYTMRDRVQYGTRQFKKVIAQEVEEIFPQAVSQHTGFLPDVYAVALEVRNEGDSLLCLTLPQALKENAKPGQLVKLMGEKNELTATVARPASGSTLVVRGAQQLAGQKVFVFGLEHADVRTVDYEALAMLNVSATQELARQVEELKKQNAALRQQTQQQTCRLDEQQAALQSLQAQATTENASLAERLKALENMLGTKAEASH